MKLNVAITEEELREIISSHLKSQGLIPPENLEEDVVFTMNEGEIGPVFMVEVSGVTVAPKIVSKTVSLSSITKSTRGRVVNLDEEDSQKTAKEMAEINAQSDAMTRQGPRLGKETGPVRAKVFKTFEEIGKDPADIADEIS
jgi:hypothetical protein